MELNQPINWDKINEEYSGAVFGLNYVYVFEENDEGKLKLYSRDFCFGFVFVCSSRVNELKHVWHMHTGACMQRNTTGMPMATPSTMSRTMVVWMQT